MRLNNSCLVFLFKMVRAVASYGENTHQVPNVNGRTWERYKIFVMLIDGDKDL